jgi:hypothetical protein
MRAAVVGGGVIVSWLVAFTGLAAMGGAGREPLAEQGSDLVRFGPGRGYRVMSGACFVRRDLMRKLVHAAARVTDTMGGAEVAFLDMSERDGRIPGSARGEPRHPPYTHERGRDVDVGYYRTRGDESTPVCPVEVDGVDEHHCVGAPDRLDACRTALFVADLFETPGVRAVGVDGRAAPELERCLDLLVTRGTIAAETRARVQLAYEIEDGGRGWYRFHDSHMHVSWQRRVVVEAP